MPSIFSKLIPFPEMVLPFNCYEVGHTWTPFCSRAALDIGISVLYEGLKMYTGVYLFGQLAARRFDFASFRQTVYSILRSSIFLGFNAWAVLFLFCASFRSLGKLYLSLIGHLPSIIGSYMAIHLEKPSRRGPLAFYVTNIAAETVFKIAVSSGLIKPINNGEVILFTFTMSILMYYAKKNGIGNDMISNLLKFVVGRKELPHKSGHNKSNSKLNEVSPNLSITYPVTSSSKTLFQRLVDKLQSIFTRHQTCPHTGSCISYVTLTWVQRFLVGWTGMSLIPMLIRRPKSFKSPSTIGQSFLKRQSINFGLFLAFAASVYKTTNCLLRRTSNGPRNWHGLVSGLVIGPTMAFYPNKTIAQYLFWKMVETLFWEGVRNGKIKYSERIICMTYALATSQLFFVAVICPENLRPSYMKFLDRFTHQCLRLLNRNIIDLFGTRSSAGFDVFYPNLDIKYTSRQFQEAVLVWTIQ